MKDAFAATPEGALCDEAFIEKLIDDYIMENDARIREQLAFITEPQKELLYAIHEEREVKSIASAAFTKKHRLKSPSATQAAAKRLLDYDFITRKEKIYSISDPLLQLWLDKLLPKK